MLSIRESKEIIISVIALSLAITFAVKHGEVGVLLWNPLKIIYYISLFSVIVGSGFVLHELGHKFTAIAFGAKAEFRMWIGGLLIAMIFALLFGFVFVAPGAVYIYGKRITRRENGIISLAGPLVNLTLFFIFGLLSKIMLTEVFGLAAYINLWLGMFNMLPIFPLDGSKILNWNLLVWFIVSALFFMFFVGGL